MIDDLIEKDDEIEPYWMKNWPEEVPRSIDYMNLSLGEYLHRTALNYPDSDAIAKKSPIYEKLAFNGR
ncbi:MAG: hypothetical protein ACOC4M_12245 [Promethearchaeia archaeon]